MDIKLSEQIKNNCEKCVLACIHAKVIVKESSKELNEEIEKHMENIRMNLKIEDIASIDTISASRECYKRLGKSPSKYRVSSEALLRRIVQEKGIYSVNNIVDINNLISIKTKKSVGSYDIKYIDKSIVFGVGHKDQSYSGIGKSQVNIENMPVLIDDKGAFGSPTSDSARTMINNKTDEILMFIYSFSGRNNIDEEIKYASKLLERYASAIEINSWIID